MNHYNLKVISGLTLRPTTLINEKHYLLSQLSNKNCYYHNKKLNAFQQISIRNLNSLCFTKNIIQNNRNSIKPFSMIKNNYSMINCNLKIHSNIKNALLNNEPFEFNFHNHSIRYLSALPEPLEPEPEPELELEMKEELINEDKKMEMEMKMKMKKELELEKEKEESLITNKKNYENNSTTKEEEEDELNIILRTKDNFFVREWKELKSFLWHLIFGSQILIHETQQALELKQKRIDNIPLSRRESLLIRRSFHDRLCVIPFFVLLAIEPYYLFLLSSVFPTLVPSVYVTPHILKKNLEKNKKQRRKIAKSAAKLAPWVPFDVDALNDEEKLVQLSKTDNIKQFDVDSLSWWHLKSCAGYLGLYGMLPKTILKIRLDEYFDYIKSDDEFIQEEGINSLTLEELRLANEQRGFNALGKSKKELTDNLRHWINFFSNDENVEIPRMVMILSHIYSDNIIFQAEMQKKKELRKQKRKAFLKKFSLSSKK